MKIEIPDKYFVEEELKNTPGRYERFLHEWLIQSDEFNFTVFNNPKYDQMIMVTNVPMYSMCSHHLLPFFGIAHIAYIPNKKICGLSKIPRAIDKFAHRPQIQEKLTNEIKDFLVKKLQPHWLMVIIEAEHLCMTMRGIRKPGSRAITNAIYENPETKLPLKNCKDEFIATISRKR